MSDESASNSSSTTPPRALSDSGENAPGSSFEPRSESQQQTVISKRKPSAPRSPLPSFRPSEIGAALEGEQLGHFLLEEYVGGGGMGAVFRGLDTMLGRIVAVKVVSSENTDEDTLRRFRNEAQSAARLDHPNIARVYYVGEDKGWNYIVFEFIEGVNVRDLVERKGPCTESETVSYAFQLADALSHAAERDVVHRDIKPSNILVMPNGRAKLVDMGLARLHQVDAPANDLTATGVTLGTFDYISPEQARDPRSADTRSDLYSLGCTLYYMLTGMPPFPEGTVLQKLLSHSSEAPPDPRELRPGLSEDLASLVLKLMSKLPSQRHQDPQELIADLAALAARLGLVGISRAGRPLSPVVSWPDYVLSALPWVVPIALLMAGTFAVGSFSQGPNHNELALERPALKAADPLPEPEPASDDRKDGLNDVPGTLNPLRTLPDAAVSETAGEDTAKGNLSPQGPEGSRDSTSNSPVETMQDPAETEPLRPPSPELKVSQGDDDESPRDSSPPIFFEPINSGDTPTVEPLPGTDRIIVTSATLANDDAATQVVPTMSAALALVAEDPSIELIEIREPTLNENAFTIDLRNSLTIQAGAGFRPKLVFRPNSDGAIPPRHMIKAIGRHNVRFVGIDFILDLPNEPSPECSLFHLTQIERISLENCTLTIRNEFGVPASFFHVQGPRLTTAIPSESGQVDIVSPSIELSSTVARGQATLVRAVEGLPFWLLWNQGLFTSSERMIDAGGLLESSHAEIIRVDLTRVTASMSLGLARVGVSDMQPILPMVDIRCHNTVLLHLPESPLVEHLEVASIDDAIDRFRYGGEQNSYASTTRFWHIRSEDGESFDVSWPDRDAIWCEERFAERVVRWANPSAPRPPVVEQTPADFRLEPSQQRVAGFEEAQLPPLP